MYGPAQRPRYWKISLTNCNVTLNDYPLPRMHGWNVTCTTITSRVGAKLIVLFCAQSTGALETATRNRAARRAPPARTSCTGCPPPPRPEPVTRAHSYCPQTRCRCRAWSRAPRRRTAGVDAGSAGAGASARRAAAASPPPPRAARRRPAPPSGEQRYLLTDAWTNSLSNPHFRTRVLYYLVCCKLRGVLTFHAKWQWILLKTMGWWWNVCLVSLRP